MNRDSTDTPQNATAKRWPRIHPLDEHNRRLVSRVHPKDWTNPTPRDRYGMVVVGAGTAGLVTAAAAAGMGAKVALIERNLMGGDCLNTGCVPSKALIRCAHAAADARRAGAFGVRIEGGITVDFPAVMERMRRLRGEIAENDSAERFASLGVDVFLGEARFTARDALEVGGRTLRFRKACIATGSHPAVPPIPGLREAGFLTNETIFSLTERPRRLAVIGAGPIGSEMAQAFARLGSEVHLIEASGGILPREDRDMAGIVQEAMRRDGVSVCCGGKATAVRRDADGKRLTLDTPEGDREIVVDQVLLAVGRQPNVDSLNLDAAHVKYDKNAVGVDDRLRTGNPRVFAAGDVALPQKFTHVADATARIVARNALLWFLPGKAKASHLHIPWCIYTDPAIAHVGAYPHELEERGERYDTVEIDLAGVDRAILQGETEGKLKVHAARRSGRILGASLVGREAGEMISELTTAMVHGIPLHKFSSVIHPYPTRAEAIKQAGDQYFKRRLLVWKDRLTSPFSRRDSSSGSPKKA